MGKISIHETGLKMISDCSIREEGLSFTTNLKKAVKNSQNIFLCLSTPPVAGVGNVRRGIGTDSRIGQYFLFAGIGYGGSFFPKEVQAIHHTVNEIGNDFKTLKSVIKVNESQKISLVPKIEKHFRKNLSGKIFGVWGLAFKPETDDVREASALYLLGELVKRGVKLKAYDPEAIEQFKAAASDLFNDNTEYVDRPSKSIEGVDALVICTECSEFRISDLTNFHNYMDNPVVFDGRNLYDLDKAREAKITYISVGRPEII